MKFLHKIRKEIKIGAMLLLTFSAIAFIEKKQEDRVCREITIQIDYNGPNYFLDKEDIYELATSNESIFLIGSSYRKINLKQIESRILDNEYIAEAEAFTDLRGRITIDVRITNPIARVVLDGEKDKYICENGRLIPTSEKHTSRVTLLSGEYFRSFTGEDIKEDPTYMNVFKLIQYIHQDEFWKAQITQIDMNSEGYITMFPQVTKQYIEFGKPENIEKKFIKLKTFYDTILPYKGWNHYSRVNLEYEDQIVCE